MSEFSKVENISNQTIIPEPDSENDDAYITLISSDGFKFKIPKNIACISRMIEVMIESDENCEDEDEEIPLPNVDKTCLEKIIEFMYYHKNDPVKNIEKPLRSNNLKDLIQEFYCNFLEIDEEFLFRLINSANYLDISPLLDLTCAKVASMIKGKSPEEIRKLFDSDDNEEIIQNNTEEKNDDVSNSISNLNISKVNDD